MAIRTQSRRARGRPQAGACRRARCDIVHWFHFNPPPASFGAIEVPGAHARVVKCRLSAQRLDSNRNVGAFPELHVEGVSGQPFDDEDFVREAAALHRIAVDIASGVLDRAVAAPEPPRDVTFHSFH